MSIERIQPLVCVAAGLAFSPFLLGVVNRVKSCFGGRRGPSAFQLYRDLWKLLQKGVVYSRTTTWVFRANPVVTLSCALAALMMLPAGDVPAPVEFGGDLLLFLYLLGVMRFSMVAGALDTGSSFEGMGASREVFFSALAEPALMIGLAAVARFSGSLSLSGMFGHLAHIGPSAAPGLLLAAAAFLVVFLVENARIPFDDPNTHLELTMIHEVMILDYAGPDLAMLLYASALKLWLLGALLVNLLLPFLGLHGMVSFGVFLAGMVVVAALTGLIESVMARLSLLKAPQLLVAAGALATLAFALALRVAV